MQFEGEFKHVKQGDEQVNVEFIELLLSIK